MDVTTVTKMHIDDLPAHRKSVIQKPFLSARKASPVFVWVIFTNLRMVGAYLTSDEAYRIANGIEHAYIRRLLPPDVIDRVAQGEADLADLIDSIAESPEDKEE